MVDRGNPRLYGRMGHLSDEQEIALIGFKSMLSDKGLYITETIVDEKEVLPASHEDGYLLRFLRAARFDLQAALRQFQATENWRSKEQVDELYNDFDVDEFEETRKYVKVQRAPRLEI
jgi:hypothetical protein